jgi:hypothetical protein
MVDAEPRFETPETLKRLQLLFDEIWNELTAADPHRVTSEAAAAERDRLAVLVVKHMATNNRHLEVIKREIIAAFKAGA